MEDFVLDCSVTMTWCFNDEATEKTLSLLESLADNRTAYTPGIWTLEVANVLLVAERKKRIRVSDSNRFLSLLKSLPVETESSISLSNIDHITSIGRNYQLSSYDSAYLELAWRKEIPLATLDSKLESAAKRLNIPCITQ